MKISIGKLIPRVFTGAFLQHYLQALILTLCALSLLLHVIVIIFTELHRVIVLFYNLPEILLWPEPALIRDQWLRHYIVIAAALVQQVFRIYFVDACNRYQIVSFSW